MKKSFLKKLAIIFSLGLGLFALGACQTTDHTATVDIQHSQISIVTEGTSTSKRTYAEITIVYVNPTIYDATQFHVWWEVKANPTAPGITLDRDLDIRVAHGVTGYTVTKAEIENIYEGYTAKFVDAKATKYASVWDTYIAWWITVIVLAAIAYIFFIFDLFKRNQTVDELRDLCREKMGNAIVVFLLVLLICLFPLIWGGWVASLILVGGFLAFLILAGITTGIRIAALNKKA